LLVVLAIMAVATAGVVMALRDGSSTALEREAQRLVALLESGRAQSRMSASPVRWHATETGFAFEGLPGLPLPTNWLGTDVRTERSGTVLLGPEPIIGPQQIDLVSVTDPSRRLTLATDGVHPFAVRADDGTQASP
jgi:general secretion pathway protein H